MKIQHFLSFCIPILFMFCSKSVNKEQEMHSSLEKTKENNGSNEWLASLENADSFEEEVTLLSALIRIDSLDEYTKIISNRLQTFDLRHLNDKEKLSIIRLYKLSFTEHKSPTESMVQIAYAKLNYYYPDDNELLNKELAQILAIVKTYK